MADLPDEIRAALRDIVHAAIDQGATCQRLGSFVAAEPGLPVRSVYDLLTEQAVDAMLSIWPVHVNTFLHTEAEPDDPGEASDG